MNDTNDTSNLDHRELTEIELDAVTGGTPKLYEAACKGTIIHEVALEVRAGLKKLNKTISGVSA
jgi:hypothetical protein